MWLLFLVAILLTFLSGGRLRTRMDRLLVGAVAVDLLVVTPLSLMFAAVDGNLLLVRPDAQIAGAVDTVYRALDLPISVVCRRGGRRTMAQGVAAGAACAAPQRGRKRVVAVSSWLC